MIVAHESVRTRWKCLRFGDKPVFGDRRPPETIGAARRWVPGRPTPDQPSSSSAQPSSCVVRAVDRRADDTRRSRCGSDPARSPSRERGRRARRRHGTDPGRTLLGMWWRTTVCTGAPPGARRRRVSSWCSAPPRSPAILHLDTCAVGRQRHSGQRYPVPHIGRHEGVPVVELRGPVAAPAVTLVEPPGAGVGLEHPG